MKLDVDDFELFGVPRRFEQDRAMLDAHWRALQAGVHPDRFVTEGAVARRVAMQWAVRVNEAYQRLKDPLKRAAYLCELAGFEIGAESNTAMPAEFLVQQLNWREALEDAKAVPDVLKLQDEVAAYRRATLASLHHVLDEENDPAAAVESVRALMFVERFAHDIDQRLDQLGH